MSVIRALLAAGVLLAAGLQLPNTQAAQQDALPRRALAEGELEELRVLGRKVLVYLPPAYASSAALPLVLALHGGGGNAQLMAEDKRYGWRQQADLGGFIVAFPNGASRLPGGRLASWNAGACCGYARDQKSDDVAFIRAVVAALKERLRVDSERVFATGMSNGGMMAHRLACDAADLFRAVAAVAGTDATERCQPSRPIPVLHIHARDDDHVLYAGGAGPNAFRDRSSVMEFVSVEQTMARWVQRDQCRTPAQPVLQVAGASCEAYRACAAGVSVQLCVTDSGGHSWPGPTAALDATREIWRFFSSAGGQ